MDWLPALHLYVFYSHQNKIKGINCRDLSFICYNTLAIIKLAILSLPYITLAISYIFNKSHLPKF